MPARLVTIGDSLAQGFQHGAIRRPEWSYPAMVARALDASFRQADFAGNGLGGPLMDLAVVARELDAAVGEQLHWWNLPHAALTVESLFDRVEDYWERGPGTQPSPTGPTHHNLAVWGFEVLDAITLSDAVCFRNTRPPTDNLIHQSVEFGMYRTARRVLNPSQDFALGELTQLAVAKKVADAEGGIENLLLALGANNALGTCAKLKMQWSQSADLRKLAHQRTATIWEPEHFRQIYGRLVEQAKALRPERVFVATVPHVTIPPVARGVSPWAKAQTGSTAALELVDGYYEYYTHFWIWDSDFDPNRDPAIKREDARAVDAAIDEYNAYICQVAAENGWHVVDLAGMLDQLAFRRRQGAATYAFPDALRVALQNHRNTKFRVRPDGTLLLDSRFFQLPSAPPRDTDSPETWQRAFAGGLFGLDGVHPTTIGYGLVAHEVLRVMQAAGVVGATPGALPWNEIVANDNLVTTPPAILASLQNTLDFLFSKMKLNRIIQQVSGYGSQPFDTR